MSHETRTHDTRAAARRQDASRDVVAALGWFSIALGAAEVLAPHTLTRALGLRGNETLVRAYGVREIATGIGILTSRDPTPWLWGRVAGDALDMVALSRGLQDGNPCKANIHAAMAAVAGVAALDVFCVQSLSAARKTRLARPMRDYRDRIGFPRPADEMRGVADDFETPGDMRAPVAMRPYGQSRQEHWAER